MSNLEKLESFLISNSDISKEFINDFFGFQKKQLYEEYKPFTIDLEDVAYWLETRKSKLREFTSLSFFVLTILFSGISPLKIIHFMSFGSFFVAFLKERILLRYLPVSLLKIRLELRSK